LVVRCRGIVTDMQAEWLKQKERGSPFLIRLIGFLAQKLGRSTVRLLLYPISLYFVFFIPTCRNASKQYLARVLGHTPTFGEVFQHFHTFAATILDRVYLLTDKFDAFDVEVFGYAEALELYRRGKGCLLLGSHLGSFELLRSLAMGEEGVVFRTLMYQDNAEKMNSVLNSINPKMVDTVIPIGKADSLLQVMEAMDKGQLVGMLGDRVALDDKIVSCKFFAQPCSFPAGPMILAGLLQVPVILFFGIYRGGNRYEIHFEVLSTGFSLERERRATQLQELTQRYVDRLEYYCRKFPYNWFNFYDYWKDDVRK
jgi:predicted LPLAT superfamily acyltransferase